jgi:hypothetical protein
VPPANLSDPQQIEDRAEQVPPAVIARLDVDISELEDLHTALTSLIAAARRAGVKPLPAPAKDSV